MSPRRAALIAWTAVVAVVVLWRGVPVERAQVLVICLVGLLAASVGIPGRVAQAVRDWVPIAVALAAYDLLRGLADEPDRTVQVRFPARIDEALFGVVPSVWLQQHIPDTATWWSMTAAVLYVSHFIVPLAVAAVVWWRSRHMWVQWRRRFLTITTVALACFLVVPVAPPWIAARVGAIGPVARTANDGWSALGIDIAADVISYGQATTNLYAAMPSLHASFALLTALTIAPLLSRPAALLAMLYPLALGFVLVATGEHYAVDVAVGFALVAVVELGWRRWERRARTVARSVLAADATRRWSWVAPVVATTAIALVIRLPRLDRPRVLAYDEVFYVNDAIDIALRGRQPGAFHPPFAKLLIAPFVGIGGVDPLIWRLPMLVCGVAVVAITGMAGWLATSDRRMTALAGFLAATDGLLVVTGRLGLLDGVAALCSAAMLAGLIGVYARGGWSTTGHRGWAPVIALVAAGVGIATKWSLVPAAAVTVVALVAPVRRRLRLSSSVTIASLVGACVVVTTAAWDRWYSAPGPTPSVRWHG